MKRLCGAVFLILVAAACSRRDEGASRTLIQNKGSDTLVNVAQAWAENYKVVSPNVGVAVSGGGSGTGISALINGTVDIANASRRLTAEEIEMARKNGIEPVEFTVGFDALAIYLHKDNPVRSLTFEQLAGIYGEGGEFEKWAQLGATVPGCSSGEIIRVSRQNNSGTFAYFKEAVLGHERDYKLGSRDMHGSKDVVDLVAKTPCAIGYSGLAYATPDVRTVCVSRQEGEICVLPSVRTAVNESYPIARPLLMYTRGEPQGAVKGYLDWILSDDGQCILSQKGYAPTRHVECS